MCVYISSVIKFKLILKCLVPGAYESLFIEFGDVDIRILFGVI